MFGSPVVWVLKAYGKKYKNKMLIYQAHNPITDSFYIGKTIKTIDVRKKQHEEDAKLKRTKSIFHKAIRKYGIDVFEWVIIEMTQDYEELNNLERKWIKLIKESGHKMYNMTEGGEGGSRCGIYANSYGKVPTKETKEKISLSLKKYYETHNNPMLGISLIGNKHTIEAKNKISESKKGKKRIDMLGSKNKSARKIYCETTGEYFETITSASIKYNLNSSKIIECCKRKIDKTKGYSFSYV
jgi:group I intron endonuclease